MATTIDPWASDFNADFGPPNVASIAFTAYSKAVLGITKGSIGLSSDTFVIVLVTDSYVPAPNSDALWSAVSANELGTGGGYTAGGLVLGSVTDTLAVATVKFTAASPIWPAFSAGPFRYSVVVRRAGGSLVPGDLLLAYSDLTGLGSLAGNGGSFVVTIGGSGILVVTAS